ncbi:MAG: hypothetical protein M1839_005693 [Geoglossum umbratile]|nr:MAG: hypothetical protein M1839_005693 [Geoglossum umbratile]
MLEVRAANLLMRGVNQPADSCGGATSIPSMLFNTELYVFEQHNPVLSRYRGGEPLSDAPKLFTPLAAAYLGDVRYLFYVDDDNIIRDRRIAPDTNNKWVAGKLFSDMHIKCAQYSKLAAITVSNRWGTSICLYYQSPDEDAAIKSVNFKQGQSNWQVDTTRVTDPPLYGTSLTAVLARDAFLWCISNGTVLNWRIRKDQVRRMDDMKLKFAPHTSLSAVDDIGGLQYFYTSSDDNFIRRVIIKQNNQMEFDTMATPTPRSAIAAVRVKPGKVVLFYQALEKVSSEKVLLFGLTLSESGGVWDGKPSRPAPAAKQLR